MNTTEVLILLNAAAVVIGLTGVVVCSLIIRGQIRRGVQAFLALKKFLAAELETARPMEH